MLQCVRVGKVFCGLRDYMCLGTLESVHQQFVVKRQKKKKKKLEDPGIDPGTSRMLSERSTI